MKKLIKSITQSSSPKSEKLILDLDYYINEKGQWVFTEHYHLKRGYCCTNGCKHCPYGEKKV